MNQFLSAQTESRLLAVVRLSATAGSRSTMAAGGGEAGRGELEDDLGYKLIYQIIS